MNTCEHVGRFYDVRLKHSFKLLYNERDAIGQYVRDGMV